LILKHIADHDVNIWKEADVAEWIGQIGQKKNKDISQHAGKFLAHNINGKRLLMMTKADLRNIGISSEGTIIDIHVKIYF
jgi:DNA polymerase III delta subunit